MLDSVPDAAPASPTGFRLDAAPAPIGAPALARGTFAATRPVDYEALVYMPDASIRPARLPLVLALHGAGERGTHLSDIARHGLTRRLADGFRPPFAVVAPQCPDDRWWDLDALLGFLDSTLDTLGADPALVAVTGFSMGGYGAWGLATRAPERLAACAPVCGGGHTFFADRLTTVPIRAYHGALDEVVPLRASVEMVEAVNALGGDATLTVYPDAAHDSWTPAYADDGLYAWLEACWAKQR